MVLRFTTHRSCIRQLFALQHTDKSSVMQAIVGPTKRFHHMRDVDPRGTRVVQKPIAEREPDKLPIAFRPGDVLLASSPVGSLTRAARLRGIFFALWAWKADKRSLKSWNIRGRALHRVSGKGDFRNCVHPFIHGPTLPVAIFVGLHFLLALQSPVHGVAAVRPPVSAPCFAAPGQDQRTWKNHCRVPPRPRVALLPTGPNAMPPSAPCSHLTLRGLII